MLLTYAQIAIYKYTFTYGFESLSLRPQFWTTSNVKYCFLNQMTLINRNNFKGITDNCRHYLPCWVFSFCVNLKY